MIDWPPNSLIPPYSLLAAADGRVGRDRACVRRFVSKPLEAHWRGVKQWQPPEAFVPMLRRLPAEMVYMRLADPRPATPVLIASLPVLVRQSQRRDACFKSAERVKPLKTCICGSIRK